MVQLQIYDHATTKKQQKKQPTNQPKNNLTREMIPPGLFWLATPWKINILHIIIGVWESIFLSKWGMAVGSSR